MSSGSRCIFSPKCSSPASLAKGGATIARRWTSNTKGLSIADVLDLTVNQAAELLSAVPPIHDRLRMLREVGLELFDPWPIRRNPLWRRGAAGQIGARTGASLDRALALCPRRADHRAPFRDIKQLLELLHRLTDLGNTMIIVEHNLDVIKSADYVFDLGPGGGTAGGDMVAQGRQKRLPRTPASATGRYLRGSA